MSTDTFLMIMDLPQGIMIHLGLALIYVAFTRDIN